MGPHLGVQEGHVQPRGRHLDQVDIVQLQRRQLPVHPAEGGMGGWVGGGGAGGRRRGAWVASGGGWAAPPGLLGGSNKGRVPAWLAMQQLRSQGGAAHQYGLSLSLPRQLEGCAASSWWRRIVCEQPGVHGERGGVPRGLTAAGTSTRYGRPEVHGSWAACRPRRRPTWKKMSMVHESIMRSSSVTMT